MINTMILRPIFSVSVVGMQKQARERGRAFSTVRRSPNYPRRGGALCVSAVKTVQLRGDDGQEFDCEFDTADDSQLLTLSLGKPLGLYLAEKRRAGQGHPDVVIDEIILGGNASRSGLEIGDIVKAVTARSQDQLEYGKGRTKENLFGRLVLFKTEGESFDTVMSAIASNKCSQCDIQLVIERPCSIEKRRVQ